MNSYTSVKFGTSLRPHFSVQLLYGKFPLRQVSYAVNEGRLIKLLNNIY